MENIEEIVCGITKEVVEIIDDNYNNYHQSFYNWLTESSDSDFVYVYESHFKLFYLPSFTTDTERILSYFAYNLHCAVASFHVMDSNLIHLKIFIKEFVKNQFKNIDAYQLFMED
jgi:hypothetical protein